MNSNLLLSQQQHSHIFVFYVFLFLDTIPCVVSVQPHLSTYYYSFALSLSRFVLWVGVYLLDLYAPLPVRLHVVVTRADIQINRTLLYSLVFVFVCMFFGRFKKFIDLHNTPDLPLLLRARISLILFIFVVVYVVIYGCFQFYYKFVC